MKKKLLVFLLLLGFAPTAAVFACLNEYYAVDKDGKLVLLGHSWKTEPIYKNHNAEKAAAKLILLEERFRKEKNYMLLSDYAVGLMKLGKAKEALEILKVLYKHYPCEYRIVANLGTAHELNGQPDSALKYIRLDLKLNPKDHEGSEWIHVKILQAKLALQKDPQWLKTKTVLQLTDQQKKDTTVQQQLLIQLQERVPFTPGPDAIVGNLFADLGDITANVGTVAYARVYYRIAKEYYGVTDLDEKIEKMNALLKKYASVKPEQERSDKGMREKVSNIQVKDVLIESPYWGKPLDITAVNTNAAALLAMVNYTKTPEQIRDSVEANKSRLNELGLTPGHDTVKAGKADTLAGEMNAPGEKTTASENGNVSGWLYIGLAGLGVGLMLVVVVIRRRGRKQ